MAAVTSQPPAEAAAVGGAVPPVQPRPPRCV